MLQSYLTIAWRSILRSKVYAVINLSGLSVGVACCLLLILYIQDEVSFDQHHTRLGDLYRVTTKIEGNNSGLMATTSPPIANALETEIPEVEFASRLVIPPGASKNLIKYKENIFYESEGAIADSSIFDVLTYRFTEGEASRALTDPQTVVITDVLAKKLFGNDKALDQVISIQGVGEGDFKITGVIKENRKTFLPVNFIISMSSKGGLADYINSEQVSNAWAGQNFIPTVVRLSSHHNLQAVVEKMNVVLQKFGGDELRTRGMRKSLGLEPIKDIHLRSDIGQSPRIIYIYVIGSIAAFILLIASINFVNLSTAKASKRAAEIGVRKVMGAVRSALVGQILSEAMLIVFLSIIFSVVMVYIALPWFNLLTGKSISLGAENTGYTALALSLLTIITGLLAGAYPAFYISSFQPAEVLKGKFTASHSSSRLRGGLVVFQFIIAITLLCGVIIISRQLNYMQEMDLGFDAHAKIVLPLRTDDAKNQYETLQNELTSMSTVKAVSAADYMPGSRIWSDARLFLEGENVDKAISILCNNVDSRYRELIDVKLIAGRTFADAAETGSVSKVIINRAASKAYGMEAEAAIGRHLFAQGKDQLKDFEIIGVMEDYHQQSLKEEIRPTLFWMPGSKNHFDFMVISLNTADFHNTLEKIESLWKVRVGGTPFEFYFLDDQIQNQYLNDQKVSGIVTAFAIIAGLISCLGLYGLSSFMAERRFKEIGIRKVMGASAGQITGLLSKDFVKLVLVALAISIPGAWYFMDRWLQGFAYRIPVDVMVFVYATVIALMVALLTVSFESVRASLVNPVKSLKSE